MTQLKTSTDAYREQLNEMHRRDHWNGGTLLKYLDRIEALITENGFKSMLDYGCGKARAHPEGWAERCDKFDPGYPPFNIKPVGRYDLVICTDALEHVEEEFVDNVLQEIFNYATKHVFLGISTAPAKKMLPDGRNAHITIKPRDWWMQKIGQFRGDVSVSVYFE